MAKTRGNSKGNSDGCGYANNRDQWCNDSSRCGSITFKNVPVFNCHMDTHSKEFDDAVKTAIARADALFSIQEHRSPFALYFSQLPYLSFQDVRVLCEAILKHLATRSSKEIPIIIVIQSDYAKVIGQTIQAINQTVPIICIDQIKVETGDYIDIGQVLPSGVVPIVVKHLLSTQSKEDECESIGDIWWRKI